ncbi:MAG: DUF4157 domain-containing protein [Bryobacteraceae bacterium]
MKRPSRPKQPRSDEQGGAAPPGRGLSPSPVPNRGNHATERLLAESAERQGDRFERQASQIAEAFDRSGPVWPGGVAGPLRESPRVRRAPLQNGQSEASPEPAGAEPAGDVRTPAAGLLVGEDVEPGRGQMRKSDFLAALRSAVCDTASEGLAGSGYDTDGCPWIDYWFSYYDGRDAGQVERAIIRYAPSARGASSAGDYIAAVAARVRRSVDIWVKTGEVTGIPDDIPSPMPGGDVLGAFGGMFFKAKPGGPRQANPAAVREQLGSGHPLPGDVRSRMESAFGSNFSGVRIHDDATGAQLSGELNARAFTVGEHVAFGAGEFRPGTIAGDALVAHELAHVVQQGGAPDAAMGKAPGGDAALEEDADLSAISAVSSLWAGVKRNAGPAIRSGLRLQRCGKSEHQKEVERLGAKQYAFMEDKRKKEEERLKREQEEEAKKKGLEPPKEAPKVELGEVIKKDQEKHALKGSPTTEWDTADQPAWRARADAAWKAVVASVKGTELEDIADGVTFNFDPAAALKGGFYASQNGHTLTVGMSWVRFAEQDPKNVWENLAHEMAGHFEYGETYSKEIMEAALSGLSDEDRKKFKGDPQKFFETYEYPETEIYASLWQRRYRVPVSGKERPSGGIHPDKNIMNKLNVMKDTLEPEVAKAVLKELKKRVDANKQILQRDKDFLVEKVKEVFKYGI